MHDLVTIGDIKLDTFVVLPTAQLKCALKKSDHRCELCFEHGAKIPVEDFEPQIAGSAANVAVGMRRLGFRSAVVAVMGADATATLARARLKEERVDARYLKVLKGERSSYSIVMTYAGERTMLTAHRPHHYRLPALQPFKWLYLSELGADFAEVYRDAATLAQKRKANLAINPGTIQLQAGLRVLAPTLKQTDALFVNTEEAHILLGMRTNGNDLKHLIAKIWKLGPAVVVVTDGRRGAYAYDGGDIWHCPAFPAEVVEMTGAGDSFATGFLAARMREKPLAECLRWGAVNAASVVAHVGPQPGLLTKTGMRRVLRANATITAQPL